MILLALLSLSFATSVEAASLSLSANKSSLEVGDMVTISLLVNTTGQAINSASGQINFPVGTFEVVSVSKAGSIFPIWVEEPSFSSSNGVISFEGGVPNPGFSGPAGKILNVVFRAKRAGTTVLTLLNASIRANDGLGTEIIDKAIGQTLTITKPPSPSVVVPTVGPSATTSVATTSEEMVHEVVVAPTIVATTAPLIVVEGKSYGDILGKILIHYLTRPEAVWILLSVTTLIIIILLIVIKVQRKELLRLRQEARQIRPKTVKKNNLTP